MSLNDLVRTIDIHSGFLWGLIIVFSMIIEISPIKINPWTKLATWISKRLTGDLKTQIDSNTKIYLESYKDLKTDIDSIKTEISALKESDEKNRAMTSRYRIIRAADEIRNGVKLSDDHIEQLGEDIDIYDKYCKSHPSYLNHKGQRSKEIVISYERQQSDALD